MIWPTDILSIEKWVLIGTLLGLLRYYLHRKWSYFKKLNLPYEPPSILGLGSMIDALKKRPFTFELEMQKKYGPIYGYFIGTLPLLTIHDVDMLRQIFQIPDRTLERSGLAGKELEAAMTAARGAQWKRIRSTVSPSFSTSKLKQMVGLVEWCVDNTVDILHKKNEIGDGTFNAKGLFSRASLDIVLSSAFSTKANSQDDTKEEPEISKMAKKLFERNAFSLMFILYFLFPPSRKIMAKMNVTMVDKKALDYFRRLTNQIIEQRKQDPNLQSRVDMMQLLLNSEISDEEAAKNPEKGLTRTEIVGNSIVMILAGYENTANAMSFLAYNLAMHPEIQTQLQEEIDNMVESHGKFDYEGLHSLKFLDMCLNETLRLYMPITRNTRTSEKEVTVNGFTIPARATVCIPAYAFAHDPDHWDEPYEFNPERMRNMEEIDPIIFQPFGGGPRNCIGMRFALIEVKMVIAKLLQKFTFKPAANTPKPPLELTALSGTKPKVDYDLRAVPRESVEKES